MKNTELKASNTRRPLPGAHSPARGAVLAVALAIAAPQALAEDWKFSVTPYLWLPSLSGDSIFEFPDNGSRLALDISSKDILSNLDFALLVAADARKGRLSVFSDLIFMDLGNEKSAIKSVDFSSGGGAFGATAGSVNGTAKTSVSAMVLTAGVGLNVGSNPAGSTDLFVGARYADLNVDVDWTLSASVSGPGAGQTFPATGSVDASDSVLDALVGIRGRASLGGNWFMPYYADVGAGDSDLTWQALVGVGYAYRWGDVVLAYRYLDYDFGKPVASLENLSLSGVALGAVFHF